MSIQGKKIDVAGPLHAATAEGLLTEASEINYQKKNGEDTNTQNELDSINDKIDEDAIKLDTINSNIGIEEYPMFDETANYTLGTVVRYTDSKLYRFTTPHAAGEWKSSEVEPWNIVRDWEDNHARILDCGNAFSKYGGARTFDCGKATN